MAALLLISPAVSLFLYFYLNSSGPLWFVILPDLPIAAAYILYRLRRKAGTSGETAGEFLKSERVMAGIILLLYLLLIAGFLLFILILPESLYQGWLRLLAAGRPGGTISFTFVYAGGLVSSLGVLALILWRNSLQALLTLFLLCTLVGIILYPLWQVFLIFLALLLFKIYLGAHGKLTRADIQISLLVLLPALMAFILPLKSSIPRGSTLVDGVSSKIQESAARMFPGLPLFLQIPGYGYSHDKGRFTGEAPILTEHPVFTLTENYRGVLYLRSGVFYRYYNGGWSPDPPGEARAAGSIDPTRYRTLNLTVETDLYTRVPLTPDTAYFVRDSILYNTGGAGSLEPPGEVPLTRGETITLLEGPLPVNRAEDIEYQLQRASAVPSLSDKVSALAGSLRGESSEESLENIRAFLAGSFSYTLETGASERMVDDFLFTSRKGYCVHFSTAAALLARALEIPVRMAEGFLVQIPPDQMGETYAVRGLSAHQWPEIYSEGRGWIPWEVTPPFISPGGSETELSDTAAEGQMAEEDEETMSYSPPAALVVIALGAALVLTGAAAAFKARVRVDFALRGAVRRARRRGGIPSPERIGWVSWYRLCRDNPGAPQKGERGLELLLRYSYDEEEIKRSEKKELLRAVRRLRF